MAERGQKTEARGNIGGKKHIPNYKPETLVCNQDVGEELNRELDILESYWHRQSRSRLPPPQWKGCACYLPLEAA